MPLKRWFHVRRPLVLARIAIDHMASNRAPTMAAALTYRTLFSLPPLLILGAVTARAFLGRERILTMASDGLYVLGVDAIQISSPDPSMPHDTLGLWILDLVSRTIDTDLTAMTWLGIVLLLYSGYALATQIEHSFDDITGRRASRGIFRSISAYWLALTAGPLIAAAGLLMGAMAWTVIESLTGGSAVVRELWNFFIAWALLVGCYSVLPTVPLPLRANIVGGVVAGVLVLCVQGAFGKAIISLGSASIVYGSAGALTLFMLWIYMMWLCILYGLQVATLVARKTSNHTSS
ncbi:MAG: YihY/virulence factor BrkB family protein [Planctomycetota bacterium]|nr:YihY/virulence factor BrkB family protein [Planctomycetota bacterium]